MGDSSAQSGGRAPADALERFNAVASLLRPSATRDEVDRFERLLASRGCPPEALRLAETPSGEHISAIVVPGPGKVGVLLMSPLPGAGGAAAAATAVADALAACSGEQIRLVQTLIDPADSMRQASLEAGGLTELALLHTMDRALQRRSRRNVLPSNMTLLPCLEADQDRVASLLDRTYQGTLDCPGLLGKRDSVDTIQGHKHSGTPVAELWCIIEIDGQDAGLLFTSKQPDAFDLVYIGLVPEARGRGFGRAALSTLLHTLQPDGRRRVRLSVDSANTPAVHLYEQSGFSTITTARALIATISPVQAPSVS
ncbi:MAG: GNAT family N-acetyltransferase [Phycisphaerales bacterium]|nr:GNAT family N-acetyltransferase [Phycisphaerales bacterium]